MKKGICLVLAMLLLASLLWGCAEESSRSNRSSRDRDETESHSKMDIFDRTPGFDFGQSDTKIDGDPATLIVGEWSLIEGRNSGGKYYNLEENDEELIVIFFPDGEVIADGDSGKWWIINNWLYMSDGETNVEGEIIMINNNRMILKSYPEDDLWVEVTYERVN